MLLKVDGIVIRSMDYGEGHKIISVYTREAGKMSVMARGAKKLKSRHGAITQLFTYGQFVIYKGGQMGTLNAGEIIDAHSGLHHDITKGAYGAYIAELYDKLTGDGEPSSMMFEQLLAALKSLEEGKDPATVSQIIEMKMLMQQGYMPELDQCVSCGRVDGDMALSSPGGGLLCGSCKYRDPYAIRLSGGTLKLLRLYRQVDLRRLGQVGLKPETKAQLKSSMKSLMDTYIDIRLKSRSFLEQMEKYDIE